MQILCDPRAQAEPRKRHRPALACQVDDFSDPPRFPARRHPRAGAVGLRRYAQHAAHTALRLKSGHWPLPIPRLALPFPAVAHREIRILEVGESDRALRVAGREGSGRRGAGRELLAGRLRCPHQRRFPCSPKPLKLQHFQSYGCLDHTALSLDSQARSTAARAEQGSCPLEAGAWASCELLP